MYYVFTGLSRSSSVLFLFFCRRKLVTHTRARATSVCGKKGCAGATVIGGRRRQRRDDDDDDDERAPRGEQRDTPPRGGHPLVADAAAAVKETAPIFFLNWNHVIPAVYLLFRNRINRTRREHLSLHTVRTCTRTYGVCAAGIICVCV